jgi:hypothetical protein
MKQEFVHARFRYYQGITATRTHFADRHVLLYNTFDYPTYCLAIEDVKTAFRVAYSVFDKVAYFLNDYLELGIPERRVTFRSIWYTNEDRTKGVKPECVSLRNWPLRGLFWLSKDLFEPDPGFQSAIEPDAQELNEIRNHLEHKYLKIHEMWSRERSSASELDRFRDRLAYSVQRQDFEAKALRILKHARAALIYLSLAVHHEERRRRPQQGDGAITLPLFIDTFDDRWKV